MLKIAVFASGEGTNLQALIDACENRSIPGKIVLVLSNKEDAGALQRAERAGIPHQAIRPNDFSKPEAYDAFLTEACQKAGVELICLAGYLRKLHAPILEAFPDRILNIHPALLPAFGGKGMYGMKVHESVLETGAKVSGCTIHFADAAYDHGPILLQSTVQVLSTDTPELLAARVRQQEHWLYPEAVKLIAENRVTIKGRKITIAPCPHEGSPRIRRALISLSDKEGVVEFARELSELGVEIVSTSGTARKLEEAGIRVRSLDSLTGFPEILDGRVKTLHPKVHGGILLRRSDPRQAEEARTFGLEPIDLVAVNLYPFERVAAGSSSPYNRDVIENIDIGGVTLIRAAAKNFEDVAVVVDPSDYRAILDELAEDSGRLNLETRRKLALTAIEHTARYDAMISEAWRNAGVSDERFPPIIKVGLKRIQTLRYGENPHQNAALYVREERGKANYEQIHGKELSYNNLLDTFGTWDAVNEFETPTAVMFKHVTPSGIGTDPDLCKAFEMAWASDPLSAFGGILAVNRPFPLAIAENLGKRFVEVIVAPSFDEDALEKLRKKKNLRLIVMKSPPPATHLLRSLGDEVLVTEPDRLVFGDALKCVTKRKPTPEEEAAMRFAWRTAKHVKSNAIVLAGPNQAVGIGAGQMSRVDSVHMAGVKYEQFLKDNEKPSSLALASDAFFPFRDGIDSAAKLGPTAIIQPGGSIRDEEVIAAADEYDIAMVLTGMRHFRH